jgi:hypothetical protein
MWTRMRTIWRGIVRGVWLRMAEVVILLSIVDMAHTRVNSQGIVTKPRILLHSSMEATTSLSTYHPPGRKLEILLSSLPRLDKPGMLESLSQGMPDEHWVVPRTAKARVTTKATATSPVTLAGIHLVDSPRPDLTPSELRMESREAPRSERP